MLLATTILGVLRGGKLAVGGDGQVTMQNHIVKHGAVKVRRLGKDQALAGFAGAAADAFTLFERFESKLSSAGGVLTKAAVELAKDWRADRVLRRLEALLVVGDREHLYILSGTGDIIQPDDGIVSVGSGSSFALGAARALSRFDQDVSPDQIVRSSLEIAAESCPFTNSHIEVQTLN